MAKKCLKYGFWKPCIILYGAIIEAVLIDRTGIKKFEDAIDKAWKEKIITRNSYYQSQIIRNLRNYVHLHRELKEKIKIGNYLVNTFANFCEDIIKTIR